MHRTVCHQLPSKMNKLSLKNTNTYCVHCTARELLKIYLKQLLCTLYLAMHTAVFDTNIPSLCIQKGIDSMILTIFSMHYFSY